MSKSVEIQNQVKKYLASPSQIQTTHKRILSFLFHTPFEILIPKLTQFPPSSVYTILNEKTDRVKTAMDFDMGAAFPYQTLSQGMEKGTEDALAEFVSSIDIQPSKKLLVDLLSQKAIQDIIANIIESGIIEFNKKTNPLFGVIQATGLDKQIKSFINLFLPNFLPKIADFLHNTSFGASSTLTKDIVYILLNAPFTELNLPGDEAILNAEKKLELLLEQIDKDKKLETTVKNFSQEIQSAFLKKYGKVNLIEFLNISETQFESFNTTISQYLTEEFIHYHKQNSIEALLSDIVSDIMNA